MSSSLFDKTRLNARKRREVRFQIYCKLALASAAFFLALLITTLVMDGWKGFMMTEMKLRITFDQQTLDPMATNSPDTLKNANYNALIQQALRERFPDMTSRADLKSLYMFISSQAPYQLRDTMLKDTSLLGKTQEFWLPVSDKADMYMKGRIERDTPEAMRSLKDRQLDMLDALKKEDNLRLRFNSGFFTTGDSLQPEQAGFLSSMAGSLFAMIVCIGLVFPLGVMTAIYLEEFAPRNRFIDLIEVNINNLAAIPSIVFGLLGLAIYISVLGMPRSAALVGGLTLALMVLPTIIITTRVALESVPGTIREAARALGASPLQVVMHHVFPLALPGIMTGTILGMARAIGETAPLLMIGMVAFVADIPKNFTDPATAMPVQVYLWANNPEMGFAEKASAGILVLLLVLVIMNSLAIYIRKRFEKRW